MGDDQERPSALLTNAQRAWFRGEKEYQPAVERDLRSRIRDRIRAGVQDFTLIIEHLDLADIKKALETPAQDEAEVENGLVSMMALVYLFITDHDKPNWVESEDLFAKRIERAVTIALNQRGESVKNVEVGIEIDRGDPFDDLLGKGIQELSYDELTQLNRVGEIDDDAYIDEIIQRREGTRSSEAIEAREDPREQADQESESGDSDDDVEDADGSS